MARHQCKKEHCGPFVWEEEEGRGGRVSHVEHGAVAGALDLLSKLRHVVRRHKPGDRNTEAKKRKYAQTQNSINKKSGGDCCVRPSQSLTNSMTHGKSLFPLFVFWATSEQRCAARIRAASSLSPMQQRLRARTLTRCGTECQRRRRGSRQSPRPRRSSPWRLEP